MGRRTSEGLALLVILLSLLLLLTSAAMATATTAKAIDASKVQWPELPDSLVVPESVAFDGRGTGPYVNVANDRVLWWGSNGGIGSSWTAYTYTPNYTKNSCATPSELSPVAIESRASDRWTSSSTSGPSSGGKRRTSAHLQVGPTC
jgi:hypothetical protein